MWADATIHYHTDVKASAIIPAAAVDEALAGIRDMEIRIKGNKASSSQGNITSITDWMTQDLILVDAPHKRFAKVPADQYAEQIKSAIPAIPEQARAALASMKTSLESRSTGRTATIQGIETEEHEFVVNIDMALPAGTPASSPFMKIVMQMWTPKPEEAQRVPALQEFKNYITSAGSTLNPVGMIKQVLSGLPGLGDNLSAMVEEISKNGSISLRMHMELSVPFLAALAQQSPPKPGELPAGFDPNAPLMQMTQELVELSSDALDDAIFQVPADYQSVPLEEILQGAASIPTLPQFKH
jgi:hypothetical protein